MKSLYECLIEAADEMLPNPIIEKLYESAAAKFAKQSNSHIGGVVRPAMDSSDGGGLLGNEVLVKAVSVGFCNHQYEFNSAGYQSCLWCGKSISG